MQKDQIPEDAMVIIPWRLDVTVRSEASQRLFRIMTTLSGNGIGQLVLMRLRPTGLQRSPWPPRSPTE